MKLTRDDPRRWRPRVFQLLADLMAHFGQLPAPVKIAWGTAADMERGDLRQVNGYVYGDQRTGFTMKLRPTKAIDKDAAETVAHELGHVRLGHAKAYDPRPLKVPGDLVKEAVDDVRDLFDRVRTHFGEAEYCQHIGLIAETIKERTAKELAAKAEREAAADAEGALLLAEWRQRFDQLFGKGNHGL